MSAQKSKLSTLERPEVLHVSNAASAIPRVQANLGDWLRRTPGNAERLVVETHEQTILDMEVVDALQRGPDLLAEQIYRSSLDVAHTNERETKFSCTWFRTGPNGEPVVAIHTSFRLGSNVRDGDHFDGTAVSIISQLQAHQEKLIDMVVRAVGPITEHHASAMESMRSAYLKSEQRAEALAAQLEVLRAQLADGEEEEREEDSSDEFMKLGMQALTAQLKQAASKAPKQ